MRDPLSRAAARAVGVLSLLLIAASAPAGAETKSATPFGVPVQQGAPSAFATPQGAPLRAHGPFGALLSWVADTQQGMQRELATSVKRLKSGNAIAAALALAGLSFLYGIVHAVGPGHGKTIISSYVIANEETVRRGVMISFIAAGLQALTAILLVGVLLAGRHRAPGQCLVDPARKRELRADCAGRPLFAGYPVNAPLAPLAGL